MQDLTFERRAFARTTDVDLSMIQAIRFRVYLLLVANFLSLCTGKVIPRYNEGAITRIKYLSLKVSRKEACKKKLTVTSSRIKVSYENLGIFRRHGRRTCHDNIRDVSKSKRTI